MQATIQYIKKELGEYYPKPEINGLTRRIIEHVCKLDYTTFLLKKDEAIKTEEKKEIERIVKRLKTYEPIQYILGETEFFGLNLKVNSSVLIPRSETEELIQLVLESNLFKTPKILDIGTGSGCIALALKKEIRDAQVTAIDVSKEALETARRNAVLNSLEIDFIQANILKFRNEEWNNYDIVISNPPYVREFEKAKMQPNVLNFEPEQALFVSDNDPLIFYQKTGEFANEYLNEDGQLFFEINEFLGAETEKLLHRLGFENIALKKDIHGKDRFLSCAKGSS